MNHIKSILVITFALSISGFVVWYILSMNDLKENYNVNNLSPHSQETKELKERDIKHYNNNIQYKRHIIEEDPIIVQKSNFEQINSRKILGEREKPENPGAELRTQLPSEAEKSLYKKEPEESPDHSIHEDLDVEKISHKTTSDPNKTISVTKKNNTISITLENRNKPKLPKNTAARQPVKALNEIVGNITPRPTSTILQR